MINFIRLWPHKKHIAEVTEIIYSVQDSGIIIKKVKLISVKQQLKTVVDNEVKHTSLCLLFGFLKLI